MTSPAQLRRVVDGRAATPGGSLDQIRGACGARNSVAGVSRLDTVGVDGGRPAGIAVGRDAGGRRVVVVVALDGCTPLQQLALG